MFDWLHVWLFEMFECSTIQLIEYLKSFNVLISKILICLIDLIFYIFKRFNVKNIWIFECLKCLKVWTDEMNFWTLQCFKCQDACNVWVFETFNIGNIFEFFYVEKF